MAEQFDPYHRWLGIRPENQPADHYRLLGLSQFEDDPEVVRDAAERQIRHVRSYELGENRELARTILNELARARSVLLDDAKRTEYDEELRSRSQGTAGDQFPATVAGSVYRPAAAQPAREIPPLRQPARRRPDPSAGKAPNVAGIKPATSRPPVDAAAVEREEARLVDPQPGSFPGIVASKTPPGRQRHARPNAGQPTKPGLRQWLADLHSNRGRWRSVLAVSACVAVLFMIVAAVWLSAIARSRSPEAIADSRLQAARGNPDVEDGLPPDVAPELVLQTGHSENISCLVFSPDSQHLLTGSDDGTAILWDADTLQPLRTFHGKGGPVSAVAFAPGGKRVFTALYSHVAALWDVETGARVVELSGHDDVITDVAFSADGEWLLTGARDKRAVAWDAASGRQLRTFGNRKDRIMCVAISPAGDRVAIGYYSGPAVLFEVSTANQIREFAPPEYSSWSVAFHPDGKQLALACLSQTVLFDIGDGGEVRRFKTKSHDIAFSADGSRIMLASSTNSATLWDFHNGERIHDFRGPSPGSTGGPSGIVDRLAALSPDGKTVATTGDFHGHFKQEGEINVWLWDAVSGEQIGKFRTGMVPPSPSMSEDGKWMADVRCDNVFRRWDLTRVSVRETFHLVEDERLWDLDRAGNRLLTRCKNKALLRDALSGTIIRTFEEPDVKYQNALLSDDGRLVLTITGEKSAALRDAATGAIRCRFQAPDDRGSDWRISREGKRILARSYKDDHLSGTLIVWDASNAQQIAAFSVKRSYFLAFSPDGQRILAQREGGGTVAWETTTGKEVKEIIGLPLDGCHLRYSGDGKWLFRFRKNEPLELYEVSSRQRVCAFSEDRPNSVAFAVTPDNRLLFSRSGHGIDVFRMRNARRVARMIVFPRTDDWLIITPEGYVDGTPEGLKLVNWRVDNKLLPMEAFAGRYHRPDLILRVLAGESITP